MPVLVTNLLLYHPRTNPSPPQDLLTPQLIVPLPLLTAALTLALKYHVRAYPQPKSAVCPNWRDSIRYPACKQAAELNCLTPYGKG